MALSTDGRYRLRDARGTVLDETTSCSDAEALAWAAGRGQVQRWTDWPEHPSGKGGYWSIVFPQARGPAG